MLYKGLQLIICPMIVVVLSLGSINAQNALPTRKVNKEASGQAKAIQKKKLGDKKIGKGLRKQKLQKNKGAQKNAVKKGAAIDRESFASKRNENKKNEVKAAVTKGNQKVRNASNRIAAAKKKLEQQKQQGKINDTAYSNKLALIKKAEAKLLKLNQAIDKGSSMTK